MSNLRNIPDGGDGAPGRETPRDGAAVAHELNNLLDGSLRNVSLALTRLGDARAEHPDDSIDDDTLQRLDTATLSMRQMAVLLQQWMVSSRARFGEGQAQTTLEQAVRQVLALIEPTRRKRGIRIDVAIEPDAGLLPVGPMQPVIFNGLRNAMEAIADRGSVRLVVTREGEDLSLQITDNGPGVALMLPRDADGLVVAGITTKAAGHGLGLAVSRDIVHRLGGTLKLIDLPDGGASLQARWPIEPVTQTCTGERT
jgi:C4-dicarboxylate-specific signal transduction histidine kinase